MGKSIDPIFFRLQTGGEVAFRLRRRRHRFDEFAASYSLAGCSPAEPTSALPAGSILNRPAELVNHHLRQMVYFSIGRMGIFQPVLTQPRQVAVRAGQAIAKVDVTVQINDARHLLESPVNGVQVKVLAGHFTASGRFKPALLDQKTAAGRTYQAVIPLDTDVTLHFGVQHAQVMDPGGKEIRRQMFSWGQLRVGYRRWLRRGYR